MNDKIYSLLLSAIFIIHNLEEYFSFDRMPKIRIFKKIMNRRSFLFSIGIFSLFVLLLSLLNYFLENKILQKINLLILFSLTINSIQHLILSIWYRRIAPGTISAILLMFPCSVLYFLTLFDEKKLDGFTFVEYLILSPIVMGVAIIGTLWFGNFLCSKIYKKGE